ncbi:MAG: thiamine biosynthesis protein ThiS [Thermoprotei archaeon]|nr:MAG: thiamine biosynthesis protein ThiS [Thermoprotei archaeon]
MSIVVEILGAEKKTIRIDIDRITVKDLLKKLNLLSTEYIAIKNDTVVTDDEIIKNGERVLLYPVKSGG